MASKTWSAAAAGNWNTDANWSGGTKPSAGDDIIFDATSVFNCTCDVVPSLGSLSMTADYTGTFAMGGTNITCTGAWTFGANATVTGTNVVTFSGAAAQTITSNGKLFYDVTINRTTAGTLTFADATSLRTLTISSTNTQAVSWSGTTVTVSGDLMADGSGTLNCGNGITANGASGTSHFGSTLGAVTATACEVTMNGTTGMVIDDDDQITFKSLVLGANAVVTNSGATTTTYNSTGTPLTFTDGGTLTLNRSMTFGTSGTGAIVTITAGTPTINGTTGQTLMLRGSGTGTTNTIPALTISTITTTINTSINSATINLAGNLSCASLNLLCTGASTATQDTKNYNITCGAMTVGSSVAGATLTVNYGSSTISCSSYDCSALTAGTITQNFQTSDWTVTGAWTFGSTHTISEGTSSVTFSGTGATNTVTSNGKKFYDVTLNKTGTAGVTFADATSLHALTVSATNNQAISWTGTTMTATSDITIDGSGTLNCGNGITMSGASATLHIGSTVGAVTASSCEITMNGTTAMIIDDDKGVTFKSITLGASAVVTSSGGSTTFFTSATTPLTFTNGGSLTLNRRTVFTLSSTGNIIVITAGTPTIAGNTQIELVAASGVTATVPALIFTGTLKVHLRVSAGSGGVTLAGNLSCNDQLLIYSGVASTTNTFNSGGYQISCTTLVLGSGNATATTTLNFGASTVSIAAFDGTTYNTGTTNVNFSTSTWTCTGAWTFGSTHTVDPGTSTVTITNTSTITSAGKTFYTLTLNPGAGKTVTLADALSCGGNFVISTGNLTSGNFAISAGGNFTMAGAGTINLGTSTVTCTGNGSVTFSAGPTYTTNAARLIMQADHTVTASANITWDRITTATAGKTITWSTGASTITIASYVAGDVGPGAGAQVMYRSTVPGTRYRIAWPAGGITVSRIDFQDCNATSGVVTANDGTSQTRGNNLNLLTFNVVSIAPNTGADTGGTPITLTDTGNGFGGTCTVVIGGSAAAGETVVDPQTLTATTGAGAVGAQNVVITNGDGDSFTIVGGYTYVAMAAGATADHSRMWIGVGIGI